MLFVRCEKFSAKRCDALWIFDQNRSNLHRLGPQRAKREHLAQAVNSTARDNGKGLLAHKLSHRPLRKRI